MGKSKSQKQPEITKPESEVQPKAKKQLATPKAKTAPMEIRDSDSDSEDDRKQANESDVDESDASDTEQKPVFVWGAQPAAQQTTDLSAHFMATDVKVAAPVLVKGALKAQLTAKPAANPTTSQPKKAVESVAKPQKSTTAATPSKEPTTKEPTTKDENAKEATTADEEGDEAAEKEKQAADPTRVKRTLFVGNLPADVKAKSVKKLFAEYGAIESIRFRSLSLMSKIVPGRTASVKRTEFKSDKSSINAYIVFTSEQSATAALAANGTQVGEHHIRTDRADGSAKFDHKKSVFVGNLPFDVQENELYEFFKDCGPVLAVRVVRDKVTSIGRGIAYVMFDSRHTAQLALSMAEQLLRKRPVRVSRVSKEHKPDSEFNPPPRKIRPAHQGEQADSTKAAPQKRANDDSSAGPAKRFKAAPGQDNRTDRSKNFKFGKVPPKPTPVANKNSFRGERAVSGAAAPTLRQAKHDVQRAFGKQAKSSGSYPGAYRSRSDSGARPGAKPKPAPAASKKRFFGGKK